MPQHEIHYNIDDLLIGRKFPHIHQTMDILSGEGPNHRRLFHDDKAVEEMLVATNSYESAWSARYHLVADRIIRDGVNPQELPDNVRKESIIAELFDLMARGEVEMVLFPDSVISQLVGSIISGQTVLVDPLVLPPLKKNYYIKR